MVMTYIIWLVKCSLTSLGARLQRLKGQLLRREYSGLTMGAVVIVYKKL